MSELTDAIEAEKAAARLVASAVNACQLYGQMPNLPDLVAGRLEAWREAFAAMTDATDASMAARR